MGQVTSFEKWHAQGVRSPHIKERRLAASTQCLMVEAFQPAGDYRGPPLHEMLVIQDKGRARAICDFGAGKFRSEPGAIGVVPSRSGVEMSVENANHVRMIGILPNTLRDWTETSGNVGDLAHNRATPSNSPFVHQLMDRIWDAAETGPATSLYFDAALTMLWAELLRLAQTPANVAAAGGLAPWQLRRCEDFLNTHASENIGLEQLASVVNLSPFHFARAFKRSTGLPPHRYQLKLRIERAKALLETTNLSVTEIAFEIGYESPQALARLFRRETGLRPSEYRRGRRF